MKCSHISDNVQVSLPATMQTQWTFHSPGPLHMRGAVLVQLRMVDGGVLTTSVVTINITYGHMCIYMVLCGVSTHGGSRHRSLHAGAPTVFDASPSLYEDTRNGAVHKPSHGVCEARTGPRSCCLYDPSAQRPAFNTECTHVHGGRRQRYGQKSREPTAMR